MLVKYNIIARIIIFIVIMYYMFHILNIMYNERHYNLFSLTKCVDTTQTILPVCEHVLSTRMAEDLVDNIYVIVGM